MVRNAGDSTFNLPLQDAIFSSRIQGSFGLVDSVEIRRALSARGMQTFHRLCDLLGGPMYELFGVGSHRYELEQFFGLSSSRSREVAWSTAALCCKNWNQRRFLKRFGLQSVSDLVDWVRLPEELLRWREQQKPVLLVGWHAGVPYGAAGGLLKKELETLFCVGPQPPFTVPPGLVFVTTDGSDQNRAEALHTTLGHLNRGGMVYLVADHPVFSTRRVAMWNREISMAPSLGMLARISGAVTVPMVSRWSSLGRIKLEHGEGLVFSDETALYRELGAWFEKYFREHPEDLEPKFLMKLAFSPKVKEQS